MEVEGKRPIQDLVHLERQTLNQRCIPLDPHAYAQWEGMSIDPYRKRLCVESSIPQMNDGGEDNSFNATLPSVLGKRGTAQTHQNQDTSMTVGDPCIQGNMPRFDCDGGNAKKTCFETASGILGKRPLEIGLDMGLSANVSLESIKRLRGPAFERVLQEIRGEIIQSGHQTFNLDNVLWIVGRALEKQEEHNEKVTQNVCAQINDQLCEEYSHQLIQRISNISQHFAYVNEMLLESHMEKNDFSEWYIS